MKKPNLKTITPEQERQAMTLEKYKTTGHPAPKSRREFLASGLLSFAAYLAAPSFLQILTLDNANAALSPECKSLLDPSVAMIPFIHVHLAGGAAMAAQVLILDKNRQPLTNYGRVGLGDPAAFTTTTEFGNVPLATNAGGLIGTMINGVRSKGGTAVQNTAWVTVCVRSQDDSSSNPFSIMGLVNAAGTKGSLLPNIATNGGGRVANPGAFVTSRPPQVIRSIDAVVGALAPAGTLKTSLSTPQQRDALLGLVAKLTSSQRAKLANTSSGTTLGQLADCSAAKNVELAPIDPATLDPRARADISTVWGIDMTTLATAPNLIQSAIVFNALNGNAGGARIDLGGYDYHGNTRASQEAMNLAAGEFIGRILKTAELMGKPLFLHVTTDGGIETPQTAAPDTAYTSDAGTRGAGFIIAFDPKGRPQTNDMQIGHFNSAQSVDESFLPSWNVERASLAVFANYLQLNKKLNLLETIAANQFDTPTLNKILKFA